MPDFYLDHLTESQRAELPPLIENDFAAFCRHVEFCMLAISGVTASHLDRLRASARLRVALVFKNKEDAPAVKWDNFIFIVERQVWQQAVGKKLAWPFGNRPPTSHGYDTRSTDKRGDTPKPEDSNVPISAADIWDAAIRKPCVPVVGAFSMKLPSWYSPEKLIHGYGGLDKANIIAESLYGPSLQIVEVDHDGSTVVQIKVVGPLSPDEDTRMYLGLEHLWTVIVTWTITLYKQLPVCLAVWLRLNQLKSRWHFVVESYEELDRLHHEALEDPERPMTAPQLALFWEEQVALYNDFATQSPTFAHFRGVLDKRLNESTEGTRWLLPLLTLVCHDVFVDNPFMVDEKFEVTAWLDGLKAQVGPNCLLVK